MSPYRMLASKELGPSWYVRFLWHFKKWWFKPEEISCCPLSFTYMEHLKIWHEEFIALSGPRVISNKKLRYYGFMCHRGREFVQKRGPDNTGLR